MLLARIVLFAILIAYALGCKESPVQTEVPPEEIPPLIEKRVVIESVIHQYVRADTLQIAGNAVGYDTIFCRNAAMLFRDTIYELGDFRISVVAIKDNQNTLLFYAKDRYNRISDTTKVRFTHTSDARIAITSNVPRHTNRPTLAVSGSALGFAKVYCEGGLQAVSDSVENHRFYLEIALHHNVLNDLLFYGRDSLDFISDTTSVSIIHDNISPKLISSSVIDDSVSFEIDAPFLLHFDEPVGSKYIRLGGPANATIDFTPLVLNDGLTLETRYDKLKVGQDWWLAFSVHDSAGNALDSTLYFQTYFTLIDLEAPSRQSFFSSDGTKLFVLTFNPYALRIFDTTSWVEWKNIPLSYEPTRGAENPWNQHVYITARRAGKITVVDPDAGLEVAFIVPPSPIPSIDPIPWEIAFVKSGIGIVKTHPFTIQFIDSRNNNQIYLPSNADLVLNSNPEPHDYFHNEKLIIFPQGGSQHQYTFYAYDYKKDEFYEILDEFDIDGIQTIKGHEFEPIIAFHADAKIHLIDENLQVSGFVRLERQYDFTYLPGETTSIYYIDTFENEIGVADLQQRTRLLSALFFLNASDLLTSRDGRYIIAVVSSGRKLLLIEPKTFR